MKINFKLEKSIKKVFFLFILLLFFLFQINSQNVKALPMDKNQTDFVTEELRLKVPTDLKEVWLEAEKNVWDQWLSRQDGFLGREIFWNKEKEEALVLINWKNKELWKSISIQEVNKIQEKFEDNVKNSLNMNENPFKLIYEGELYKQR